MAESVNTEEQAPPVTKGSKSDKWWKWIIAGLGLLIFILIGFLAFAVSGISRDMEDKHSQNQKQIKALEQGVAKTSGENVSIAAILAGLVSRIEGVEARNTHIEREIKDTINGHEKRLHRNNKGHRGGNNKGHTKHGQSPDTPLSVEVNPLSAKATPSAGPTPSALKVGTECFGYGERRGVHEERNGQIVCVLSGVTRSSVPIEERYVERGDAGERRYYESRRAEAPAPPQDDFIEYYAQEEEPSSSWVPWAVGAAILGGGWWWANAHKGAAPVAALVKGGPAGVVIGGPVNGLP